MGEVLSRSEAAETAEALKQKGQMIVFTNGCFDIIHAGHVRMLEDAKKLGDVLFVGLNSDASVKRIKDPSRPVFPEDERAEVLSALSPVDYVVIFEEDTPFEIISEVRPQILTKGGDWDADKIVGRDIVEASGGKVVRIPYREGLSTSAIIEKIKTGASNRSK
ncbi:D-glycero-beta-D-manno-heptose 1-phosphate adenylyltransferase [Acidobacteriota bacterium]